MSSAAGDAARSEDAAPTFGELPDELLPLVLSFLPLEDVCRLQRVCRRLRRAVGDAGDGLWHRLWRERWGDEEPQQQQTQRQQQQQQSGASGAASFAALPPPAATAGSASGAGSSSEEQPPGQAIGSKRRRDSQADLGADLDAAAAAAATALVAVPVDWRERFKARFVQEARKERLKRQARRLKAENALQVVQVEVHRLEQALAREQRALPGLRAELAAVRQARQQAAAAALAAHYWQPAAVQRAHGVETVLAPQDAEAREHDLQQRLAVAELEVRKLTSQLAAQRRRAAEVQRRLQALLP